MKLICIRVVATMIHSSVVLKFFKNERMNLLEKISKVNMIAGALYSIMNSSEKITLRLVYYV
jgi:hypothetical protein